MRGWTYESMPSRSSLAMPAQSPLLDAHSQHSSSQSSRGYHQPQYFIPSSQQSMSSNMGAGAAQSSYAPHLMWHSATQTMAGDYSGSPLGTPYSETGSSDSAYYMGDASGHSVAYPESSQRTHLPEGVAFAAAMYHSDFNHELAAMTGQLSPSSQNVASDRLNTLSSPASYRQIATSQARERASRTSPTSAGYPIDTPPSNNERMSPQRLMGYPSLGSTRSANGQATVQSMLPGLSHSTPTSPHSSASMSMHTSPTLQAFDYHTRAAAFPRLGEPGSPSVVPPLVFDGETGEEYEDESEYGSLPSASSELSRHQSLRQPGQYATSHSHPTEDWANSSFEHNRSFDDIGSPTSQHSQFESHSPTHGADLELPSQFEEGGKAPKKSKMHQCTICYKWFPRPSGLATHMNSHSGAKPFKCPIPACTKSFAVRSNAKRHLRTHGIFPSSEHSTAPAQFTVGFDAPIVSDVPHVGKLPAKLRWVPQSLATRTNVDYLRDTGSDSEDEYPPSVPVLSVPLPAVIPSSPKWQGNDHFEDRNSFERVDTSPYLSSQWRALPGPAIVTPPSL